MKNGKGKNSGSDFLLLFKLNRFSFAVYLFISAIIFTIATILGKESTPYGQVWKMLMEGYDHVDLFGVACGIFGCVAGITASACFSNEKKGAFLYSLPRDVRLTFIKLVTCEFIKSASALFIGAVGYLCAYLCITDGNVDGIKYYFYILAFCFFYFVIYFSVGVFAGAVAGRAVTRGLVCFAYSLSSFLLTYWVLGIYPNFSNTSSGIATVLRLPFIYHVPYGRLMYVFEEGLAYPELLPDFNTREFFLRGAYPFIGVVLTVIFFIGISAFIFKHRTLENSASPFLIPVIGDVLRVLLTVEIYYLIVFQVWRQIDRVVKRIYSFFEKGAFVPVFTELIYFICFFFIFSAMCTCSSKKTFSKLWLFPITGAITYLLQIIICVSAKL